MQDDPPWLLLPHWPVLSLATGTQVPVLVQHPFVQVEALQPPTQRPVLQV
jgi:hypothetical protein